MTKTTYFEESGNTFERLIKGFTPGDTISIVEITPQNPTDFKGKFVGWIRDEYGDLQAIVNLEGKPDVWLDVYHPSRLRKTY